MGNCLKTQLKQDVNNPNLKKLGVLEATFKLHSDYNRVIFQMLPNTELEITVISNSTIDHVNSGEVINSKKCKLSRGTAYPSVYFNEEGDVTLQIKSKYDITVFDSIVDLGVDELATLASLQSAHGTFVGTIDQISKIKIHNFYCGFDTQNTNKLFGNVITAFGNNNELEYLQLFRCNSLDNWSIEQFVKSQRFNAGRNTGDIRISIMYSNCSYNNAAYTVSSEKHLTWEPNASVSTNTDIHLNGVDVTIDENGNPVA